MYRERFHEVITRSHPFPVVKVLIFLRSDDLDLRIFLVTKQTSYRAFEELDGRYLPSYQITSSNPEGDELVDPFLL